MSFDQVFNYKFPIWEVRYSKEKKSAKETTSSVPILYNTLHFNPAIKVFNQPIKIPVLPK